jgi:O-antigen/teichoic acid export membrane protein
MKRDRTIGHQEAETATAATVGGRRLIVDVAVQLAGRVFNLAVGVAVTLLIARGLGDGGFGQWVTILAVVQIVGYLTDLGFEQVTVKLASADREHEAQWLGALVSLHALLSIPAVLLCVGILLAVADSADMRLAGLLVCGSLVVAAPTGVRIAFQLRVRNDVQVAIVTVNSLVWAAAVVVVMSAYSNLVSLAIAFLVVAVGNAALQILLALRFADVEVRDSSRLWGDIARIGVPVGAAGFFMLAYGRLDQVLVFQYAGDRDAGLYGAASRVLVQAGSLPIVLMTTLFPVLTASYALDPERVGRLVARAAEYMAMISLPAMAFSLVAATPLVELLFGHQFVGAAPALSVLMIAFVAICFGEVAINMLLVLDLQKRLLAYATAALALNVALNLILIPRYGLLAAAWTMVATQFLIAALAARDVVLAIDVPLRLRPFATAGAAAGGMCLLAWVLLQWGTPFGALVAAAVLSYSVVLVALGGIDWRELRSLVATARRPGEGPA